MAFIFTSKTIGEGGGGVGFVPLRRWLPRIGDWFNTLPMGNLTNNGVIAERMYTIHVEGYKEDFVAQNVGLHVGTAGASGAKARIYAYGVGEDGLPAGAAINYGEVDVDTVGEKSIVGVDQIIPPQGIWLGLIASHACNIWGPQINMTMAGSMFGNAVLTTNQMTFLWKVLPYASALPTGENMKNDFLAATTVAPIAWFKRTS